MNFSRSVLSLSLVVALSQSAFAKDGEWLTTDSLIKPSKYAENFERYDHVNPNAPKGGTLNSISIGTFDSFNPFIVKGTSAAGLNYTGGLLYDSLMEQSVEEPGTSYPLIAEAFKHPADYSSATYRLNANAKFHDGKPITAEDVAWSFDVLKANYPLYNKYYGNVTEARVDAPNMITFVFDQKNNRELPHIMGDLPVLPKHWWTGKDKDGNQRDITKTTLEEPVGNGPYRIKSFKPGSEIIWERVEDYWAKDLPVRVGRYNFNERRYVYFKDPNASWEAFKKGGLQDLRIENRSKNWATGYTFPAFKEKKVIKRTFTSGSGEAFSGYFINTRKERFNDRRVREALTLAYDFETMNTNLFYGFYTRTDSYFEASELSSPKAAPTGLELEILEKYRGQVPDGVFTEKFELPVFKSRGDTRKNLRRAIALFKDAGWTFKDQKLVNAKGEQFKIEFLGNSPTDERITSPYLANLRRLGIDATLRIIDTSQYINRTRNWDFDLLFAGAAQSQSPGNEQREYWSSAAADLTGSRNYAGIKNPVVDDLVERIIFAKNREELVALTHALDRVLLWNYYAVPGWHLPVIWTAYWDKFGIPDTQPAYIGVDIDSWWIDPEKAARIESTD
ncbi:MAG: extracellular solute-binding protein [Pseudomonadota bacterium]